MRTGGGKDKIIITKDNIDNNATAANFITVADFEAGDVIRITGVTNNTFQYLNHHLILLFMCI